MADTFGVTTQYLTALSQLNGAQTQMYRIWLSYLATRIQLYIDVERLPLDNRGVWTDESGENLNAPRTIIGSQPVEPLAPDNERRATTPEPVRPVRLLPPAAPPGLE